MISIIIPVYNEEKNVALLLEKVKAVGAQANLNFELIFIDDGSTDNTLTELVKLYQQNPGLLKVIQFTKNFEKSAALMAGYQQAGGEIIITMDGDLQDDPEEIPNFLKKVAEGYDCVVGWKVKRYDPLTKTLPSKLFNFLVSKISKVKIHDFNCGFKAYTKEAVVNLNLYGGLYRFAPAILNYQGFKVTEIPVKHHPRQFGKSKYGPARLLKGFFDIITLLVLLRFAQRPAHFFGNLGALSATLGVLIILGLYFVKFAYQVLIAQHPYLFFSGILMVIVGVQLLSLGFLGEIFVNNSQARREFYRIKKIFK